MAGKKKAEEQSFLKSRFLASVSHDLRSPLHAIIGGSDILKRQNLPDESKNILEYIRVAGNNLLEQVDTILAYSKLEAGMLTLKDKTYNFYEMIEEQASLSAEYPGKRYRIYREVSGPVSAAGKRRQYTCGTDFSEHFIECLQVYGTGNDHAVTPL